MARCECTPKQKAYSFWATRLTQLMRLTTGGPHFVLKDESFKGRAVSKRKTRPKQLTGDQSFSSARGETCGSSPGDGGGAESVTPARERCGAVLLFSSLHRTEK